jgi:drug/metabolite transporter (DMT)-like permease
LRASVFFIGNSVIVWFLNVKIFTIPKQARLLLFLRSFVGATFVIGFFFAVTLIVATKATLLYNLQPIFITILAVTFLGEKVYYPDMILLVGAFIGVAMISSKEDTDNVTVSYRMQIIGILL